MTSAGIRDGNGLFDMWKLAAACVACVLLLAVPANAAGANGAANARLLAAVSAHDGDAFLGGLDMHLAKGWKTYWKKPGDSGIAPSFDWSGSENIESVDLRFPVPLRFDEPGDITFGYKDRVTWPLRIVPADPSLPVVLRLAMFYGVCSDAVCIPQEGNFSLTVPPGESAVSVDAALLYASLAHLPVTPVDDTAFDVRWRTDEAPTLDIVWRGCGTGCTPPDLIVDGPDTVWFGTPEMKREGNTVHYSVMVEVLSAAMLDGEELTFILSGPGTALAFRRTMN